MKSIAIPLSLASIVLFGAMLLIGFSSFAHASAPPGIATTVATSTSSSIGAGAVSVLFATSTCATRIITTGNSALMITFNDAQTPTGVFGHWQGASTTVAYDATQYGCGKVKGYSYAAALDTLTETR